MTKTKFAFWDVDHTFLRGDSMLLFLQYGLWKRPWTFYRMLPIFWKALQFKLGFITAEEAKPSFFYAMSALSEEDLEHFFDTKLYPRICQDAYQEIRRLKSEDYIVVLVSASPHVYLKYFKKLPEIDEVLATKLTLTENSYIPCIEGRNCYGEEKVAQIHRFLERRGQTIDYEHSCAYSDSISDMPMFTLVHHRYLVRGQHPELEPVKWKKESRLHPHIGKIWMVISALMTATGQLFWTWGAESVFYLGLGFLCYGGGAIFMIRGLSLEKLSVAYPMMCLSYVFAIGYGYWILHEPITLNKLIALILIVSGVFLLSHER
ncbi:HAD-IB family hydrolase [Paenibacillus sp. F411]|uniref:HAD-IB family hydrolase n=1 Tax=Paenibacillus sp. F411 TaxID=2820239 RepID=UPI001AAF2E48|nr:HAD-IB family hydrolase [Paenibacillus sp. F411]MBO2942470.1 HAD-IB family hydrolase [Paenibacillus sp. F411]